MTLPVRVRLCLAGHGQLVPRPWVSLLLHVGAELGGCASESEQFELAYWLAVVAAHG